MRLAAVITDNRPLDNMPEIIDRHKRFLPEASEWIWVCSDMCYPVSGVNNIVFDELNDPHFDFRSYNRLLTSEKFWMFLTEYDRVLIFQHDSGLLRNGIDEFMPYDYVGAPWSFQEHGGNGGLSLRNPQVMLNICQQMPFNEGYHGNEDVYFSNIMKQKGIGNLAPRNVCSSFSVESIFNLGTFGYHQICSYFSEEKVSEIKNQYGNDIYTVLQGQE